MLKHVKLYSFSLFYVHKILILFCKKSDRNVKLPVRKFSDHDDSAYYSRSNIFYHLETVCLFLLYLTFIKGNHSVFVKNMNIYYNLQTFSCEQSCCWGTSTNIHRLCISMFSDSFRLWHIFLQKIDEEWVYKYLFACSLFWTYFSNNSANQRVKNW